jgi:hypothetical protein
LDNDHLTHRKTLFEREDSAYPRQTKKIKFDPSETAEVLELQGLLNEDGMDRSISQVVDYALWVALANAKVPPNKDFGDTVELFSDPFERTI